MFKFRVSDFLKAILGATLILVASIFASAQIYDPVRWSASLTEIGENEYELKVHAEIEEGWHVYSQDNPQDETGGGEPTTFHFDTTDAFELIDVMIESGERHEEYDPVFEMIQIWFEGSGDFTQRIKMRSKDDSVTGYIYFMTCNDKMCLPPDYVDFRISATLTETVILNEPINTDGYIDNTFTDLGDDTSTISGNDDVETIGGEEEEEGSKGLLAIFIAGFLGGLIALVTPCVLPIIPLTVSFFTKQSKTRAKGVSNALIYSLSIIIIYVGLGMLVTITFGSDALNDMASNIWFNLTFFLVFIIFAISFFGAFEITIPSALTSRIDAASQGGGLIGIFFMAFTLVLVSFSCTGPIIGNLLVFAARGETIGPMVGMAGFALALAFPFGFFAAFPGWLNTLPKSGGWMNSVKVSLGFLELALALKFLSNVDMAYHWGILTREIFLTLWIIIFGLFSFYLLGKLKFQHDSDVKYISIPRLFFALITFSFTIYLIPGLWGAPLKLISGFPPPIHYSEGWKLGGNNYENIAVSDVNPEDYGADRELCPHNLACFRDYDEGLKYAKVVNKPVMIDFTGHTCVNCRKMEAKVWSDPKVLKRLREDYVLISLYVDDKEKLPKEERYKSKLTGRTIKSIGKKWGDLQTRKYNTNSQPYYVLIDLDEKPLTKPTAYNTNIKKYIQFLDRGLEEFKRRTGTLAVDDEQEVINFEENKILTPVLWTVKAEMTKENEYNIIFRAEIDEGWHVYSNNIAAGGPVPTSFYFDTLETFNTIGLSMEKGELEESYDSVFGMNLKWFVNQAEIIQKVKVLDSSIMVTGYFEFMTCDDKQCLAPEYINFEIPLNSSEVVVLNKPEERISP